VTYRRFFSTPITILAGLLLVACSPELPKRTESRLMLGTAISVTVYADLSDEGFAALFDRMAEIESRMSTSEEDHTTTELMRVNDAAGEHPVAVSPDTLFVVEEGLRFSEMTGGAFDVAIQPLVSLWGIGTDRQGVPQEDEVTAAVSRVDFRLVEIDSETSSIFLPEPGMGIDVGGIAKGYAADEARRILLDLGVEHAILDFGGNVLAIGTKPDGAPWRVGIQVPHEARGDYVGIVEVADAAVVTSGTYERFFIKDGIRYHHILESETGYPVENGLESVTIITEDSVTADALSTAVFVMGLEEGAAFVEELEGVEAIFIDDENNVYVTSGVGPEYTQTNDDFGFVRY
jgi:thiamine biosynthesis lipoprotein